MHAKGTFEVNIIPQQDRPIPTLGRMTIDKTFSGDLQGISQGQMLSSGDPKTGSAGYVAVERFEGKLGDREGSFVLQHNATMHNGGQELTVIIVPGSGTGDFLGISGTLAIKIEGGRHYYDLDCALPSV